MGCGTSNGMKKKGLCPVSFGLALGITSAVAFFLWSMWIMYRGLPPEMMQSGVNFNWNAILMHTLWSFVKGFLFGFILALVYDLICCCCRCRCCRSEACACCGTKNPGDKCDCGCHKDGSCKCCGKSGGACTCCSKPKM